MNTKPSTAQDGARPALAADCLRSSGQESSGNNPRFYAELLVIRVGGLKIASELLARSELAGRPLKNHRAFELRIARLGQPCPTVNLGPLDHENTAARVGYVALSRFGDLRIFRRNRICNGKPRLSHY